LRPSCLAIAIILRERERDKEGGVGGGYRLEGCEKKGEEGKGEDVRQAVYHAHRAMQTHAR
jgi:hypothetical protein